MTRRTGRSVRILGTSIAVAAATACQTSSSAPAPRATVAGSGDASFRMLATAILEDHFKRHPSSATDLGVHKYDAVMDDVSQAAITAESDAMNAFAARLIGVDPATLTLDAQLDREQLIRA